MKIQLIDFFYESISIARKLIDIGFREIKISDDERIKETLFESDLFQFYVTIDLLREETSFRWKRKGSHQIIPNPVLGICFFSENPDVILDRYEYTNGNDNFKVTIELYVENSWVFSSYRWLENEEFNNAINEADKWSWKESRLLKPGEYERKLISLKHE